MKLKYLIFFFLVCVSSGMFAQKYAKMYDDALQKKDLKKYTEAIHILSELIKGNKYYYDAYLSRGQCYEQIKQYDSALKDYNAAIQMNPDYSDALFQRSLLFHTIKNDPKKAITDIDKVLSLKPNYYDAFLLRAVIYETLQKYQESISDYSKAIELKGDDWNSYFKRAMVYFKINKEDECLKDLNQSISIRNDFAAAYFERGKISQSRASYVDALSDFEKSTEAGMYTPDLILRKADIQLELKQYKQAIKNYTQLINMNKQPKAEWYSKRGLCYSFTGDSLLAQKDFSKAISLDKNNYQIYVYRAQNYIKQKRISYAMNDYKKAIDLNPKAWDIYFNRGKLYMDMKKYNEAVSDFSLSIKLNPKSGDAYFFRGACKDALFDKEGACLDLKKAAALHHKEAVDKLDRYCR